MTPKKAKRSHKSKAEQRRLAKSSSAKVVGSGRFVKRASRLQAQGKKVKSVMLRVDIRFAQWCRKQAEQDGSVTEVTRKLYEHIMNGQQQAAEQATVETLNTVAKVFGGVKGGDDAAR